MKIIVSYQGQLKGGRIPHGLGIIFFYTDQANNSKQQLKIPNEIPDTLYFDGQVIMEDGQIVEAFISPCKGNIKMHYIYGQGRILPQFQIEYHKKENIIQCTDYETRFVGEIDKAKAHGNGIRFFPKDLFHPQSQWFVGQWDHDRMVLGKESIPVYHSEGEFEVRGVKYNNYQTAKDYSFQTIDHRDYVALRR